MTKIMLRTPMVKSKVGVDRENNMLTGFVVAQIGEAKGHGAALDDVTLNTLMELGNKIDGGAKMRFTHPNMSDDGLGKYLGRAKNFRRDGDLLRADGKLGQSSFKSPKGNLGGYVLDLAEEDPDAFGASVAMFADVEEIKDEDGKPKKGADGKKLLPVFRPTRLHAVDVVDDPAATDSMFTSQTWAAQATEFADRLGRSLDLTPQEVARKVQEFIPRYLQSKGVDMSDPIKPDSAGAATPPKDDAPKDEAPKKTDLSADQKAAEQALQSVTQETERIRCEGISMLCEMNGCTELAASLIRDGVSPQAAREKVKAHLAAKQPPLQPGASTEGEPKKVDPDQKLRDEYRSVPKEHLHLFGSEEEYVASCKRTAEGGVVPMIPVHGKAG